MHHRLKRLMAGRQEEHTVVAVLAHVVCTFSFSTSKLNGITVRHVQPSVSTVFQNDIMLPHRVIGDDAWLCKGYEKLVTGRNISVLACKHQC